MCCLQVRVVFAFFCNAVTKQSHSSQGLKSRYVPQGAKERLISLVL